MLKTKLAITCLLAALAFGASGCAKPRLIPNTQVPDTKLNREVLQVVEKYRRAMERLDAVTVLALAHPTYQDHGGTPQADDDLDLAGLKKLLTTRFKNTTKVRYLLEYQNVHVKGREAEVDAYVDATFEYREPGASPRWRRLTDYNRFRLIKQKATWRFISGL